MKTLPNVVLKSAVAFVLFSPSFADAQIVGLPSTLRVIERDAVESALPSASHNYELLQEIGALTRLTVRKANHRLELVAANDKKDLPQNSIRLAYSDRDKVIGILTQYSGSAGVMFKSRRLPDGSRQLALLDTSTGQLISTDVVLPPVATQKVLVADDDDWDTAELESMLDDYMEAGRRGRGDPTRIFRPDATFSAEECRIAKNNRLATCDYDRNSSAGIFGLYCVGATAINPLAGGGVCRTCWVGRV